MYCSVGVCIILCVIFISPPASGFILKAICNKVASALSRTFDVGGIYFRLFPAGRCSEVDPMDIEFKVYPYYKTSVNAPHESIRPEDSADRLLRLFDPSLPTAIYIHGFFEGERGASSRSFKSAFLYRGDYNFISVDWQSLATGPWYISASRNVQPVGREVARLIDRLVFVGAIQLETLHLIGFSLGAHVSGVAAAQLSSGRVPRITGLDPAYPLFSDSPLDERLDKTDAEFVDVIHTGGGLFGYPEALGHVDFFPNGGRYVQPGCLIVFSGGACSHWRAWRFFEESIRGGEFVATACDNWSDFAKGRCEDNPRNIMGISTDLTARGKYYLRTNWFSPFSVK